MLFGLIFLLWNSRLLALTSLVVRGAGSKGATIRGIWACIFDATLLEYESR